MPMSVDLFMVESLWKSWSDAGRRLERETFPILVVRHVGVSIGRAIRQSGFHVATIPGEEIHGT
jgi:hypothetical protein